MLVEGGQRSRSHGLSIGLLNRQASSLGIRLLTRGTSWDDYEANFVDAMNGLRNEGVLIGVFGDIDLEPHRDWVERVSSSIGMRAVLPLWKSKREDLLKEFLSLGFRAIIVSVKDEVLDREFLGKTLDYGTIDEMKSIGIDASGEEGEYHTFVTNGPMFSRPIKPEARDIHLKDGYWFLDIE